MPTLFKHEDVHKQYDLIINPSCEHMEDIKAVKGPIYALTSNDYKGIKGHINTISKHEELAIKNGINSIAYEGSLKLTNYTTQQKSSSHYIFLFLLTKIPAS